MVQPIRKGEVFLLRLYRYSTIILQCSLELVGVFGCVAMGFCFFMRVITVVIYWGVWITRVLFYWSVMFSDSTNYKLTSNQFKAPYFRLISHENASIFYNKIQVCTSIRMYSIQCIYKLQCFRQGCGL